MSNFTTAGNLAVSQNITVGGNVNITGNLIPSGNIVMTGGFYASGGATFNSTAQFNGSFYFGTGQGVYLSSCTLYITDSNSYLNGTVGTNQVRLAGNLGGTIGYTNGGGYNNSIYWNTSNQVGINTTTPSYTLDVNGTTNVSGTLTCGSFVNSGNFTIGNSITNVGNLILQSGVSSTTTTSGALQCSGGIGLTGNLNCGGNVSCIKYVSTLNNSGSSIVASYNTVDINICSRLSNTAYNTLTKTNDSAIIYNTGVSTTYGLVIAPYLLSGSAGIRMDANGNVGINQTTPVFTLDVNGNANITGNITVSGTVKANTLTFPYTSVPSFNSTQLGYQVSAQQLTAIASTGSMQSVLSVSIPIGVFLFQWSFYVTPNSGSGTLTFLQYGISPTSNGSIYNESTTLLTNVTYSVTTTPYYQGTFYTNITTAGSYYLNLNSTPTTTKYGSIYLRAIRIA
jgi:hypothetical protein